MIKPTSWNENSVQSIISSRQSTLYVSRFALPPLFRKDILNQPWNSLLLGQNSAEFFSIQYPMPSLPIGLDVVPNRKPICHPHAMFLYRINSKEHAKHSSTSLPFLHPKELMKTHNSVAKRTVWELAWNLPAASLDLCSILLWATLPCYQPQKGFVYIFICSIYGLQVPSTF